MTRGKDVLIAIIDKSVKDLKSMKAEKFALEEEVVAWQAKTEACEKEVVEYQADAKKYEKERNELRAKPEGGGPIAELEDKLKDVMAQCFDLGQENAKLKRKRENEKATIPQQLLSGLQSQLKNLREQIESYQEIEKDRDFWKNECQNAKAVLPRSDEFQERQLAYKDKEIQDERMRTTQAERKLSEYQSLTSKDWVKRTQFEEVWKLHLHRLKLHSEEVSRSQAEIAALTYRESQEVKALKKEVSQLQAKYAIAVGVTTRFHELVAAGEPDATGAALQAFSEIRQVTKRQRRE